VRVKFQNFWSSQAAKHCLAISVESHLTQYIFFIFFFKKQAAKRCLVILVCVCTLIPYMFLVFFFLKSLGGKALSCYSGMRVHVVGDRSHPVVHHLAPHPDPHGTVFLTVDP